MAALGSRVRTRLAGCRAWPGVALGVVLALAAVSGARAYWTSGGTGGGSGTTASLTAPTMSGTPGAGTALLAWGAVTPPGSGAVAYYVRRGGGDAGGNCPTESAPTTVLTCTDAGMDKGTYGYTVTAVWRSWTATSAPSTQVTLGSGALNRLSLAAASTTPAAGATDALTITAVDLYGNTVTTFTGSHTLTFAGASVSGGYIPTVTSSGGAAVNFGTGTAISFTLGVATVGGSSNGVMTLYRAETASLTVAEGGSYTSSALAVTVSGAALASFTIPTPATQTAGAAFTVSITAKDTYGNTATYAGSQCVAFSGPATSPGGTAPAYPAQGACAAGKSALTFTAGVAASVSVTLYAAASPTLTATDAGKSGATGAFTVGAAALNRLSLAAASTTPAAGATDALTITAVDLYGNTVTTYTGTHTLTFAGASVIGGYIPTVTSSGGAAVNFGTGTAISFTLGVATVGGSNNGVMTLYRAETASLIVAEGGSYTSSALAVTVHLPAGLGLKIQYYNRDPGGTNKEWIFPGLKLFNTGSVSVTLSQVDVRYWFTHDSGASTFQTACNYATVDCSNLTYDSTAFTPTRPGADSYLHVGFLGAAGSLATGAAGVELLTGVAQTDWSELVETNDYSYGANATYADTTKVTVYVYGNLVWGTEP